MDVVVVHDFSLNCGINSMHVDECKQCVWSAMRFGAVLRIIRYISRDKTEYITIMNNVLSYLVVAKTI